MRRRGRMRAASQATNTQPTISLGHAQRVPMNPVSSRRRANRARQVPPTTAAAVWARSRGTRHPVDAARVSGNVELGSDRASSLREDAARKVRAGVMWYQGRATCVWGRVVVKGLKNRVGCPFLPAFTPQ